MQPHIPFLILHIAAGTVALVASVLALVAPKGGLLHGRAGKMFVFAMTAVGFSALVIAILRPNAFLFTVGLFSLYLATAGREAARPGPVTRLAAVSAAGMLAAAVFMVGLGGAALAGWTEAVRLTGRLPPAALLAFGVIGATFAVQDLRANAAGREKPRERIARHLARMGGAAIAAWTAFVVVNARFLPPILAWLGPTLIFLPVIVYWRNRVKSGRSTLVSPRAAPRPS